MAHIHSVVDSNEHFVIDPITRIITNSQAKKISVMQYDHNSERLTFEIPKVDGHDMTDCDRVEIHYINMDALDKTLKSTGVYEVKDIHPASDNSGVAVFSWLLSRNCTKYAGSLTFLIHFACTTDGVEDYAWNTAIFQSIAIGNGMNNGEEVIEPYADVLAQWKDDLFGVGDTQEQRLLDVSAEQQAAISARGEAVLATIPDEYEALSALADDNHRNKAGAIILNAKGESIVVNDASDYMIQNLKVFGKSTQDGTPTPDAPVDIVSTESPVISMCGKNMIPFPYSYFKNSNTAELTATVQEDGGVLLNGTVTQDTFVDLCIAHLFDEHITPASTHGFIASKHSAGIFTSYDAKNLHSFIIVKKGTVCENVVVYPQIEKGFASTDYAPYMSGGNLSLERTLRGIPVSSGGNYTDENGQQWICDEVDLVRGVYVQRVEVKTLYGNDYEFWGIVNPGLFRCHTLKTEFLCDRFENTLNHSITDNNKASDLLSDGQCCLRYGESDRSYFMMSEIATQEEWLSWLAANPLKIVGVLDTPIETALSDAEINAFKALHSNKTVTTVLNDSGAFMEVEYIADTKTYIDNKISELLEGSE